MPYKTLPEKGRPLGTGVSPHPRVPSFASSRHPHERYGHGEVYLKAYESVAEARAGIGAYLRFYNSERPHQTLDYRTPAQVFEEGRNQVHQSEVSLTPELVPA